MIALTDWVWEQKLSLGTRIIGPGEPCLIIAEIGGNFNGSYDLALRSIDAAMSAGADAVKFQTYLAEDIVADPNLQYQYKDISGNSISVSQLEMFKKMEFPYEWHEPIMRYANDKGVLFLSSAADPKSVDFLCSLGVPAMKIASEDLINIPVVERVASSGLPTMISTGMATEKEIENALAIFKKHGNNKVLLFQCTSQYPTPPEACNLSRMISMRGAFKIPVGFSDHTKGWLASALSVAMGACVIEKHFTLDHSLPGPDHLMSTDPAEFKEMVRNINIAAKMIGSQNIDYDLSEEAGRKEYRRSIVARLPIKKGLILTEDMLAYRRPGTGLKPYEKDKILGKVLKNSVLENQQITEADVLEGSFNEKL